MKSISARRLLFCALFALLTGTGCSGCRESDSTPEKKAANPPTVEATPPPNSETTTKKPAESNSRENSSPNASGEPSVETNAESGGSKDQAESNDGAGEGTGSSAGGQAGTGTGGDGGDGTEQPSRGQSAGGPASALSRAKTKFREAEELTAAGKDADAFVEASDALSLVRRFPKDAGCSALTKQIEARLAELSRTLRKRAPQSRAEHSFKTLVEK